MNLSLKNQRGLLTILAFLATTLAFGQFTSDSINEVTNLSRVFKEKREIKKSNLGVEITAFILPKARITRNKGNYRLRSHLQSAYDIGLNYLHNVNKSLLISSGLHLVIGKRNFFAHIPSEDINNSAGGLLIEDKDLWGSLRIPVLVEKKINQKKTNWISIRTGLSFRYSGFMSDLSTEHIRVDSNNQYVSIFNAELSGSNNGKPWVTFLAGISKLFVLDNKNILSLGLLADISTTYFFKGDYMFTIPNQPITTGVYKINGTSLGLSVQYSFTGSNKRLIRSYQEEKVF